MLVITDHGEDDDDGDDGGLFCLGHQQKGDHQLIKRRGRRHLMIMMKMMGIGNLFGTRQSFR